MLISLPLSEKSGNVNRNGNGRAMDFAIDSKALVLSLAAGVLFYFLRLWESDFAVPRLYFSNIQAFEGSSIKSRSASLPKILISLALLAFFLAFLNPRLFFNKPAGSPDNPQRSPTEGIAIYLVLDQSGSMKETVFTPQGSIRKVDLLKQVTKKFIEGDPQTGLKGRPNDLIGLIEFARAARVLSPLTLDHAALISELGRFAPVPEMDQDGTSIGYAIYKTASMIAATKHYAEELSGKGEPAYTIKNTILILITDGMQDPNPLDKGKRLRNMDVPEAAAYAKEQGVRLYFVNVEPKLATEEFAPYRHIMQRAAELTGGKFYMVDGTTNLEGIYRDIDALEKSSLPEPPQVLSKDQRPDLYHRVPFYPYLVGLGLFFLFAGLLLDATFLRRVP
jgi:Ca-activated chloride channel homolog